jgi:hypothetical protein
MCYQHLGPFKDVYTLVPHNAIKPENLTLRLDSLLFLYKADEMGFGVYEAYSIKNRPVKIQNFCRWEPGSGLSVPVPNLWDRRKDLGGIEIRNAVLDWHDLFNVGTDGSQSTGLLPEIIETLRNVMNFSLVKGKNGFKEAQKITIPVTSVKCKIFANNLNQAFSWLSLLLKVSGGNTD